MRKLIASAIIVLVSFVSFSIEAREGGMSPASVPRVVYSTPGSQTTVDVSGGRPVVFSWAMLPIPGGTRDSYRLVVHKGSGYNVVFSKVIDDRTFSIEVPAEKFENGAGYWWYVRQRDARTMIWSEYDVWYFKVTKK